jgi:hypothetical protein
MPTRIPLDYRRKTAVSTIDNPQEAGLGSQDGQNEQRGVVLKWSSWMLKLGLFRPTWRASAVRVGLRLAVGEGRAPEQVSSTASLLGSCMFLEFVTFRVITTYSWDDCCMTQCTSQV